MTSAKYFLFLIFIALPSINDAFAQTRYRSPVDHPIRLSGTFGELRGDHFHMGIDVKSSTGQSGDPVRAVASGYISRVQVLAASYGNVVYINHLNGHTSIYAHLDDFTSDLANYVRSQQYAAESFQVDLHFEADQFPVKEGDLIGKMGNSGYSFGPHLHFEIRNTATDTPLNPLAFDWRVDDDQPPLIQRTKVYHLDHRYRVYDEFVPGPSSSDQPIEVGAWRIGIGVQTYDPFNGKANKNGVYEIKIYANDELQYHTRFDSIKFINARSYLAHTDHRERTLTKQNLHRCFRLPGNALGIYPQLMNEGVVLLYQDRTTRIDIEVLDFMGNKSRQSIWMRRDSDVDVPTGDPYNFMISRSKADTVRYGPLSLYFEKNTLFEDLRLSISDTSSQFSTPVYQIGRATTALREPLQLTIDSKIIPEDLHSKIVLCKIKSDLTPTYQHASWEEDHFKTTIGSLGAYALIHDSIPPAIKLIRNRKTGSSQILTFEISDNIPDAPLSYRAELEGKWILARYDAKSDFLHIEIDDERIEKDGAFFKLVVTDTVGNSNEFRNTISIK